MSLFVYISSSNSINAKRRGRDAAEAARIRACACLPFYRVSLRLGAGVPFGKEQAP